MDPSTPAVALFVLRALTHITVNGALHGTWAALQLVKNAIRKPVVPPSHAQVVNTHEDDQITRLKGREAWVTYMPTSDTLRVLQSIKTLLGEDCWRFKPLVWARSPEAQTILGCTRFWKALHVAAANTTEWLRLPDHVRIRLDWTEANTNSPIVIIVPGIGSTSLSPCVHAWAAAASARGWRSVVVHRRGHGEGASLLPEGHGMSDNPPVPFPCTACIGDLDCAVRHVHDIHPGTPLLMVGLSMGANLAVKYLSSSTYITAALSLCNAVCIPTMLRHLSPPGHAIITHGLRETVRAKRSEIDLLAIQQADKGVLQPDWDAVMKATSVLDYEAAFSLRLHGMCEGCSSAKLQAYLRDQSSVDALEQVRVPLMCMNAMDDPLVPRELSNLELRASLKNPCIVAVATQTGGHLGWVDRPAGEAWSTRVGTAFLAGVLEGKELSAHDG
jgi:predicted alpha/beta-fold hydrolase